MIRNLFVFLIGCLIIAVVVYVCHLMLAVFELPPAILQLAIIIIALGGLVAVIYLAYRIFSGGGGPSL